jgi:hypothetical protein
MGLVVKIFGRPYDCSIKRNYQPNEKSTLGNNPMPLDTFCP